MKTVLILYFTIFFVDIPKFLKKNIYFSYIIYINYPKSLFIGKFLK